MWSSELRRAEERAQKFKDEVDQLLESKRHLRAENSSLQEQVHARDQEIARLHSSYKGGQTFDNVKKTFSSDKLQQEHEQYAGFLRAIGNVLGVSNFSALPKTVEKLHANNYDL